MNRKKPDSLTRIYQNGLLLLGILLITLSLNELRTLWTPKGSLIPLKGTLQDADVYTTTVSDRRGHESQKIELVFYLNEFNKKFVLAENVGRDYESKEFTNILRALKGANRIVVWITEAERDVYDPKVFQIDRDKTTILEFDQVKFKNRWLTAIMLVMGVGSIVLFISQRYPEKLRKAFE